MSCIDKISVKRGGSHCFLVSSSDYNLFTMSSALLKETLKKKIFGDNQIRYDYLHACLVPII